MTIFTNYLQPQHFDMFMPPPAQRNICSNAAKVSTGFLMPSRYLEVLHRLSKPKHDSTASGFHRSLKNQKFPLFSGVSGFDAGLQV